MTTGATPGRPSAFAPRAVPWSEAGAALREAADITLAYPWRLVGLYLLIYVPFLMFFGGVAYLAMPLRGIYESVFFAGYFCALEAARARRAPGLADLFGLWRLPHDKLLLLALAGLAPVVLTWLAWGLDLGWSDLDTLLRARLAPGAEAGEAAAAFGPGHPALAQRIEAAAVENLLGIPLLLLQPLCVLYAWSASRSLSANLLASLRNWRWGCLLGVIFLPLGVALNAYEPQSAVEELGLLALAVVLSVYLSAFTLVLMHRTLD